MRKWLVVIGVAFLLLVGALYLQKDRIKPVVEAGKRVADDVSASRLELYSDTKESLRTIRLGMTKQQVTDIMGTPAKTYRKEVFDRKYETWVYPHPLEASTIPSCAFDVETGKVVKIDVEDGVIIGSYPRYRESASGN